MKKQIFLSGFLILLFHLLLFGSSALCEENTKYLEDNIEVGRSYYRSGNYQKSYDIFKNLFREHPENLTINFLLGRSAFELKNYEEAVFAFERLLITYPDLDRVKLEMARTYMMLGTYEEAKHLFMEVLANNPPENVKNNINKLMQIILARERKHIFSSSLQIGRGFDDNVNTSPTDQIIEIPAFGDLPMTVSDKKSEAFTTASMGFNYRYNPPSQTFNSINTSFSYSRTDYDSVEEQNLDFFNFNITPVFALGSSDFINIGATAQHVRVFNEPYLNIFALGTGYSKNINENNSLKINLSYAIKNYDKYDTKDASNLNIAASLSTRIKKFVISPMVQGAKEFADSDVYSYTQYGGGLALNFIYSESFATAVSYRYQHSGYNENEPLFLEKRKDDSNSVSANASWRFLKRKNISATLGLSHLYIDNYSNLKIYDYNKNKTTLYLQLNF